MLILKFLSKLINILNSAASPRQIAGGFILGMMIGITPFWSLLNWLLLLVLIVINVNITAGILGFMIFQVLSVVANPLFHHLGHWLLVDQSALQGFWSFITNLPLLPFFRLNNTSNLGSLVYGLLLILPVYWSMKAAVSIYRSKYADKIAQWKVVRWLKGFKLFGWYRKLRTMGG